MQSARRLALPLLAASLALSSPAYAQFSAAYKFLEAVRKKEGDKVETALSDPGSTIINTRDVTTGETALHIVTQRRDLTWMSYLIVKGANVNLKDAKGGSPLQLASNIGFTEGVELLVGKGARVDEPNDAGETPLIAAVHRRDLAMMRILLKAGANPDRADNSGRSARDYALLDGRSGPVIAVIEANAKTKTDAPPARVYGPTF